MNIDGLMSDIWNLVNFSMPTNPNSQYKAIITNNGNSKSLYILGQPGANVLILVFRYICTGGIYHLSFSETWPLPK